jgi:hypothetical protein
VLLETLQMDDLNCGSEFCTHRGERYENRPKRGHIRPYMDFEHKRDFDDLGDVGQFFFLVS